MTSKKSGAFDTDGLLTAIDSMDADAFVSFLAEDARFRFGSAPAITGREGIAVGVSAFFDTIAACQHQVAMTLLDGNTLVVEGEVTYQRHDDRQITLPFANVFELAGELIRDYKIYIDIAPLYTN